MNELTPLEWSAVRIIDNASQHLEHSDEWNESLQSASDIFAAARKRVFKAAARRK